MPLALARHVDVRREDGGGQNGDHRRDGDERRRQLQQARRRQVVVDGADLRRRDVHRQRLAVGDFHADDHSRRL